MAAAQINNDTTMYIILQHYHILVTLCTRTLLMSPYKYEMHLREKSGG